MPDPSVPEIYGAARDVIDCAHYYGYAGADESLVLYHDLDNIARDIPSGKYFEEVKKMFDDAIAGNRMGEIPPAHLDENGEPMPGTDLASVAWIGFKDYDPQTQKEIQAGDLSPAMKVSCDLK